MLFIDGHWRRPTEADIHRRARPLRARRLHKVAAGSAGRCRSRGERRPGAPCRLAREPAAPCAAGYLRAIAERLRERVEDLARAAPPSTTASRSPRRGSTSADAAACYRYYADKAVELEAGQGSAVAVPDTVYRARLRLEPAGVGEPDRPLEFPAGDDLLEGGAGAGRRLHGGAEAVGGDAGGRAGARRHRGRDRPAAGVLNIVTGTGVAVGAPMTVHPGVAKVSFTGSNAVGARVMARPRPASRRSVSSSAASRRSSCSTMPTRRSPPS